MTDDTELADELAHTNHDLALALSRIHELEQGIERQIHAAWLEGNYPAELAALLEPAD